MVDPADVDDELLLDAAVVVVAVAVVVEAVVSFSVADEVTGCFTSQADVLGIISLSTGGSSWSCTWPCGLSPLRRLSRQRSRCPLPFPAAAP